MNRFSFLFSLLVLFCGFQMNVQDDSIHAATTLLKKYLISDYKGPVNVRIVNSHNGRYTITSLLQVTGDSIKIDSRTVDMIGSKRDTLLIVSRQAFLSKLDNASHPSNSMKLAGHIQTISIMRGAKEETFQTGSGRALMNLLEYRDYQ